MEEEREVKRSKKWLWIPIGVLAAFVFACLILVLTAKPSYEYAFLKQAQYQGSEQQVTNLPGSPALYVAKSSYRIKSAHPNIITRIDKELSAQGWVLSAAIGSSVRWTLKGKLIYLEHRGPTYDSEISIQTVEPATPIHRFQVWISNLFR